MSDATILIYDDDTTSGSVYAERLNKSSYVKKHFDRIECINNTDFLKEMKELRNRQIANRKNEKRDKNLLRLDDASILIVDYDLVNAPEYASFLTGEIVSYYVRCFSKCRYIIGLNQFGTNNFDLSLKRHPKSFADLNIGSDQLENPGLWGSKIEGFCPWYWPSIIKFLGTIDRKIEDLENNLNTPICQFFSVPSEIVDAFPRTVSEFLGDGPSTISFDKFLRGSGNTLTPKDRKKIDVDDPAMKLLTISRISKWLEEVVLPGQNILVDAPHLVHRYPSLLMGDHKDLATWNKTTPLNVPDKELGLNFEIIEKFKIKNDHWLSRPAWFLNQLIECQNIKEVKEPWLREPTDFVFCEDSSTFNKKTECKEFLIEIDTPYARRYVREFKGVNYVPRVRFAL